jgi:predicted RNase H-like nuclease (RuvC/YqgF family)
MLPTRLTDAELEELPAELAELGREIERLVGPDEAAIRESFHRVVDGFRRRRRILSLVQEALSQLRLDIKYLMFDLEATRSERDELRRLIDDQP